MIKQKLVIIYREGGRRGDAELGITRMVYFFILGRFSYNESAVCVCRLSVHFNEGGLTRNMHHGRA